MTLSSTHGNAVYVFGANPTIGTVEEDLRVPSANKVDLTVASYMDVASSSASDTLLGVGAQMVLIEGIGADGEILSELVSTSGLTKSRTTNKFLFINRSYVYQAGASGLVGNITITAATDDSIQSYMSSTDANSNDALYMIPLSYKLCVLQLWASTSKSDGVIFNLKIKAGNSGAVWRNIGHIHVFQSTFALNFPINIIIPGGTKVKMTAQSEVSTSTGTGGWTGALSV